MIRLSVIAGTLAVLLMLPVFLGPDAAAHSGATGIVRERMDAMKAMGKAIKALAKTIEQGDDHDLVRSLATEIDDLGGDAMTRLFPAGSLDHPSEALPSIWVEWDRFSFLAAEMSERARMLAELQPPDKAALTQLADTCSACHQDFRKRN